MSARGGRGASRDGEPAVVVDDLRMRYGTTDVLDGHLDLRIAAFFDLPVEVIFSLEPFPRISDSARSA